MVNRFWQFEAFYFDHGIFDSALWQVAHGQLPYIDHLSQTLTLQLADHFAPVMYLLSPLYFFTSGYEALLFVENLLFIASCLVVFFLAKKHIKSKLLVFALVIAYTLFIGIQNALIANFHTELPALFTLALALYFLDRKLWPPFFFFLLVTFGLKETFVTIGAGLGLYLLLTKNVRAGLVTIFLSLFYYLTVIKIIIPVLAGREYFYDIAKVGPLDLLPHLFFPPIKTETIIVSFLTFGALPLFAPAFLPAIFQDFFLRFVLTSGPARWDLGLHYNATLTLLLAYGAILGSKWLITKPRYKKFLTIHALATIALVLFFHRFRYHGPVALAYNPAFYPHTKNLDFLRNFIAKIPTDGVVMTQNNLAVQMTHTHNPLLLRSDYGKYRPDYVAFDFRDGQNANNFWPLDPPNWTKFPQDLAADVNYRLFYNQGSLYIYQRVKR